ncbi:MAG TPA: serine hydrolase [Acidimicrobiales bacterium]
MPSDESPSEEIRAHLEEVASERIFGTAFHVAVLSPRAEFSLSVGADALGIRAHSSQLYNVWCALKPVVALAAAELAEAHGVDPDTSVSGIAKQFPDCFATLRQIMSHRFAGVYPSLAQVALCPLAERDQLISRHLGTGPSSGYSEYSSQAILLDVIRSLSGEEPVGYLQERTLTDLHLEGKLSFGFTRSQLEHVQEGIGLYVLGLPHRALPLLSDRTPFLACDDRGRVGGFATAAGLAGFYNSVLNVLNGEPRGGLPAPEYLRDLVYHPTPRIPDPVLGRDCAFAGGFMVSLPDHGFGDRPSAAAVGHSGFSGSSWGFADPEHHLSMGFIGNGVIRDSESAAVLRRGVIDVVCCALMRQAK